MSGLAAGSAPCRRPRAHLRCKPSIQNPHSQSEALEEVHGYSADQRLTLVANFGSFVAVAAFAAGERRACAFYSLGSLRSAAGTDLLLQGAALLSQGLQGGNMQWQITFLKNAAMPWRRRRATSPLAPNLHTQHTRNTHNNKLNTHNTAQPTLGAKTFWEA